MKKALHVAVIMIIIVAILFTALMLILKYDEKGETNMPFEISKVAIISTTDGQNVDDAEHLWNKTVEQNNDVYIYIEKNKDYKKTEAIKEVVLSDFSVIEKPKRGNIVFYKPSTNEKEIFENKEELKATLISFTGDQKTEIQLQKISNQGGIIAFRASTQNLGNFVSNDEEINYNDLLKKINVNHEEIKAKISFNISIKLEGEKEFKSTIELEVPTDDVIQNGKGSKEITDLNMVFKRAEN